MVGRSPVSVTGIRPASRVPSAKRSIAGEDLGSPIACPIMASPAAHRRRPRTGTTRAWWRHSAAGCWQGTARAGALAVAEVRSLSRRRDDPRPALRAELLGARCLAVGRPAAGECRPQNRSRHRGEPRSVQSSPGASRNGSASCCPRRGGHRHRVRPGVLRRARCPGRRHRLCRRRAPGPRLGRPILMPIQVINCLGLRRCYCCRARRRSGSACPPRSGTLSWPARSREHPPFNPFWPRPTASRRRPSS